jgi:hypothetical protein
MRLLLLAVMLAYVLVAPGGIEAQAGAGGSFTAISSISFMMI